MMDVDIGDQVISNWKPVAHANISVGNVGQETSFAIRDSTVLSNSDIQACSNETRQEGRSKYKKMLYIASVGVFFNTSAFYGLINLQSSLNLRDGLGTTGLAIGYVASLLWALLVTPCAIESLGPRIALIISEISYIVYCAANYYPSFYTLVPGAVMLGFGEACCWASMSVIVTYCGEQYWLAGRSNTFGQENLSPLPTSAAQKPSVPHSNGSLDVSTVNTVSGRLSIRASFEEELACPSKTKDATVSQFFSHYFSIVKASQVIGNLLSYVTLYTFGVATKFNDDATDVFQSNDSRNVTSNDMMMNSSFDFAMCGINDCAASFRNASPETLSRYLAKDPVSVNILISVLIGMHIIAVVMHYFWMDPLPKRRSYVTEDGKIMLPEHLSQQSQVGCCSETATTFSALFRQMMSFQQLLVSPLALYFGLFLSYCLSEFTRAFVSCTLGVEEVGLVMTFFGVASVCSAILIGKVVGKYGRNPLYALAVIVDLICYASNAFWIPQTSRDYVIYLIALGFGFNAGLWEPLINSTYAHYFAENTSSAFSLWNFWGATGLCLGFTLSTTVCLATKLHVLLGVLAISILCYIAAEVRFSHGIT